MAKTLEAAKHLDQKLASFLDTATDCLANLGKHLNLKSAGCTDHADVTCDLYRVTPATLSEAQPRRLPFFSRSQALFLKPAIHMVWDAMQTLGSRHARTCSNQPVKLVDRNAVHKEAAFMPTVS
jgi:hypothetical protein